MNGMPEGKNAWIVKIGEKGQFVIPKEAREMFGIHPGDTVLVLGDIQRGIAIPPKSMMNKYMSMIFGELSMEGKTFQEEQASMEEQGDRNE